MKALAGQLDAKPAGVFYLPVNNKFMSEDKSGSRFKYVGFINTDKEILSHFDHVFDDPSDGVTSSQYPVWRSDKARSAGKICATEDGVATTHGQFDKLCDYVEKLVSKAAGEIDEGFVRPLPRGKACEYCEYGDICMFSASGTPVRSGKGGKDIEEYPFFAEAHGDETVE